MRTANGARGEVLVELDGAPRRLCLTLGALAEIETALEVSGIEALAERLRRPTARDLMAVLAALLNGGGEAELAARLEQASVSPQAAADAVARAFEAVGE